MSGLVFRGQTNTKQQIKCFAQVHNDSAGGETPTSNPSTSSLAVYLLSHYAAHTRNM